MSRSKLFMCVFLCLLPPPLVQAQQLLTFTDGQPALAAQVNANFSALLAEIQTLKTQVAALQAESGGSSVVGTWDLYNLDGTTFASGPGSMSMENVGGTGTLVLNSDGSFQLTETEFRSALNISNTVSAPCTNCGAKSLIVGTASNAAASDSGVTRNGTYTVSGTTITVAIGGDTGTLKLSNDGNLMFLFNADQSGIQLMIFSKR
jgi:hypothetical protein